MQNNTIYIYNYILKNCPFVFCFNFFYNLLYFKHWGSIKQLYDLRQRETQHPLTTKHREDKAGNDGVLCKICKKNWAHSHGSCFFREKIAEVGLIRKG